MSSTIRLREITLAVQHLYRDGEDVAQSLGGVLRDGGWFPGTGVGHKYVDADGMRVNVLSVVDYRASRASELGYAVYEAARHGTALFEIRADSQASTWPEELPGKVIYSETYRRADGLPLPSTAMLELDAGRCRVRIAGVAELVVPPKPGWQIQWGADVDWAAAAAGLGFGSESSAEHTTVTGDLGVSFRAADEGALMRVRRD
jgi:hypothetical protein